MALVAEEYLLRLLVHGIVTGAVIRLAFLVGDRVLTGQMGGNVVDLDIQLGAVFRRTGDDQRGARLVDEDGVHLVDHSVGAALHPLLRRKRHIVAQIVEAELVVGAVGDIAVVGLAASDRAQMAIALLFIQMRRIEGIGCAVRPHAAGGIDNAGGQAEEVVKPPHPLGIAARQVIVDRHHMHALCRQGVEIDRQGCHQGLALAGAHLGDLALVQHHAADQLHIEMPHPQDAPASLAHHRKGLGQQLVQGLPLFQATAKLRSLCREFGIIECRGLLFQGVDLRDRFLHAFDQSLIATPKHLFHNIVEHEFSLYGAAWDKARMIPHRETGVGVRIGARAKRGITQGGNQGARMNFRGLTTRPCLCTSKCTCGPVERPVLPNSAMTCPLLTTSPTLTRLALLCA